jgi:predicted 2-oxoglutarate/Fe(II)-dependent dioxygenase YbiX
MNNVIFSKEDCEYIKSFFDESLAIGDDEPRYLELNGKNIEIRKNAKGSYQEITQPELIEFIVEKLKPLNILSIKRECLNLIRYNEGDYFEKHRDFSKYGIGATYKTMVIQLSDPTEYEGGDLCVKDIPQDRTQGSVSLFLSSTEHEVKKVLRGTRFSLSTFLYEEDFIFSKSAI